MERQARLVTQPEGHLAAEDVHLMAAVRQRTGELRRYHAAAADRCVADNPDVHEDARAARVGMSSSKAAKRWPMRSGCWATKPSAHRTSARAPNCESRLSTSCAKRGDVSRVTTASGGFGAELGAVARQRLALPLVELRHVDDERGRARDR